MEQVLLSTEMLKSLECGAHVDAIVAMPPGYDLERTADLLVREATGCLEVDLLLLRRDIAAKRRELDAIEERVRDEYKRLTGRPEPGTTWEESARREDLTILKNRESSLRTELAGLRSAAGIERAKAALSRYRTARDEDIPRVVEETGATTVFYLGDVWSFGLGDTMEERLQRRAMDLHLPEDHDEAVLRDDEREAFAAESRG